MINVMLAGVGGQGTVLAAKVLAQAAQDKGWQVRTAETIGMAQRGGNVVSHVRMGNGGEAVFAPLIAQGTADLIVAFEPAEGARVLPYLAPAGVLVTATSAIQPVTAALSKNPYRAASVVERLRAQLAGGSGTGAGTQAAAAGGAQAAGDMQVAGAGVGDTQAAGASAPQPLPARFVAVDDAALTQAAGSRKVLNTVLLASALRTGSIPLDVDDLRRAIRVCVKPRFVDLNLHAIDVAVG